MGRKDILKKTVFLRLGQLLVNEMYKANKLKVPIHLAFGHESIAVAVDQVVQDVDQIVLSHRNIHYNMVRESRVNLEIDEFMLKDTGLAKGKLGSMNLVNPKKNIVYTSNVLGNNLPVSSPYYYTPPPLQGDWNLPRNPPPPPADAGAAGGGEKKN